ncbi:MAG: flagellar basal body protein FliL [Treponema sp.]|nr:flagellar basal body protein FliL [Treponema sp.]
MSDSDDLDLDGGDAQESSSSSKKRGGGLGNLLPTILKFVAIGLGAMIFIVTVCIITVSIINKGGSNQTVIQDPSSPYIGTRPAFDFFEQLGPITVRTNDNPVWNVTVDMVIGYDQNDQEASAEFNSRRIELIDFTRHYFSNKSAFELTPDHEESIKRDIREMLNTRFFDKARARIILFKKLDRMEVY